MTQAQKHTPVEIPDNFAKMLVGLWVFFSVSFGLVSSWLFASLDPDTMTRKWWEGFTYSAIYSFLFLLFFGTTWRWLLLKFPLEKPKALFYHAIAQILNSFIGFGLGLLITESIHDLFYLDQHLVVEKSSIGLIVISLFCLIGVLLTNGFFYSTAYMRRSMDAEKRRVDSELSALRAQINPHFLFNSLNSIAALIRISPEEAEHVTEDLADVFRYTLRSSDRALVSLHEELKIIQLYLNIEQARFKERLAVQINVADELHSTCIPVLTLQPLIENSIKHGVSKKEGNHTVSLNISRHNDLLEIHIQDTGPGFPHHDFFKLLENGTGLSNVFQRLRLHFGEKVDGAIANDGLRLRFPIVESQFPETKFLTYESVPG